MEREPLLTVGHGALDRTGLGELLAGTGVLKVVDVRRFPGSRRNEAVARYALSTWLPEYGVDYRWEERLGGRRRAGADAPDTWWRVEQFRGYAAWTRTPEFTAAIEGLLDESAGRRTAVMCAESVWWRCHRRVIADVAVLLHGVPVHHLMPDARLVVHEPAAGARLTEDGVVWDRPADDSPADPV